MKPEPRASRFWAWRGMRWPGWPGWPCWPNWSPNCSKKRRSGLSGGRSWKLPNELVDIWTGCSDSTWTLTTAGLTASTMSAKSTAGLVACSGAVSAWLDWPLWPDCSANAGTVLCAMKPVPAVPRTARAAPPARMDLRLRKLLFSDMDVDLLVFRPGSPALSRGGM